MLPISVLNELHLLDKMLSCIFKVLEVLYEALIHPREHTHSFTSKTENFRMNMHVFIHQGFGHRDCTGVVAGLCGAAFIAVLLLGRQTTLRTLAATLWPY